MKRTTAMLSAMIAIAVLATSTNAYNLSSSTTITNSGMTGMTSACAPAEGGLVPARDISATTSTRIADAPSESGLVLARTAPPLPDASLRDFDAAGSRLESPAHSTRSH